MVPHDKALLPAWSLLGEHADVSSVIHREIYLMNSLPFKPVLHPAKQCPKLGCLLAELGPGLLGNRLAVSF